MFGLLLIQWLTTGIIGGLIERVAQLAGPVPTLPVFGDFLWTGLWLAYFSSFWAVVYHDLLVAQEGSDVAQVAAVFE